MTDSLVPSVPRTPSPGAPFVQAPPQEDDSSLNMESPSEQPPQYSEVDMSSTAIQSVTVDSPRYARFDDQPYTALFTSIFINDTRGASVGTTAFASLAELQSPDSMDVGAHRPTLPPSATQFGSGSQQCVQQQRTIGPTPRSGTVKHGFQLKDNKGLTFNLQSKARHPKSTPVFHGGDIIQGDVSIAATGSDPGIQAIMLTLIGLVITSSFEEGRYTFLEQTTTVWSKESSSRSPLPELLNGHSWPICFPFPDKIPLDNGKGTLPQTVNVPQSFLEKSITVNIQYELVLRVSRGRFKSDFKFRTPITYLTRITPPPPSPLMQVSYQQNTPLAGPKVDQAGWTTLTPGITRGRFANQRDVEVEYALSLANPLCYTRGYVIPLSLTIKCQDSEVLNTLSSPKTTCVVLKRRIRWFTDAATYFARDPKKAHVEVQEVSDALIWIPSKDDSNALSEQRLEGEIHLDDTLQPSCDFPLFGVEYFVMLYPPYDDAFEPESRKAIATQCIGVGTFLPTRCPIPRSFGAEFGERRGSFLNERRRRSQGKASDDNWGMWRGYHGGCSFHLTGAEDPAIWMSLKDPKIQPRSKSKGKGKAAPEDELPISEVASFPWLVV